MFLLEFLESMNVRFLIEFLLALFFSAVFTIIFARGIRKHAWGIGFLILFLIVFLSTWAGGLWLDPFGPSNVRGIPWMTFLIVAAIVSLLLSALMPRNIQFQFKENPEESKSEKGKLIVVIDYLFWMLIFLLAALIIAAYVIF